MNSDIIPETIKGTLTYEPELLETIERTGVKYRIVVINQNKDSDFQWDFIAKLESLFPLDFKIPARVKGEIVWLTPNGIIPLTDYELVALVASWPKK